MIARGIFPLTSGGGGESSKFSTHISATAANYAAYQQKLFSSVAIMIVETTNSGKNRRALKKFSGGSGRRDEKSFCEESNPVSHKVRYTLYSYLVSLRPVSDLFGKRELILDEA